jgi:hypothetical protein
MHWLCALDETGEFWCLANPQVRRQTSITDGWLKVSPWRDEDKAAFPWSEEFDDA